jgi:hypothetical protein
MQKGLGHLKSWVLGFLLDCHMHNPTLPIASPLEVVSWITTGVQPWPWSVSNTGKHFVPGVRHWPTRRFLWHLLLNHHMHVCFVLQVVC